jgi:hypothetical protein
VKIAIVGSRRYENKKKIKDFIFKLKNEYGENTIIVSGGCKTGADKYAKKYALELGLMYEEYPPFHEPYNLYCTMPESSDFIVAFISEGVQSDGTFSTLDYAKKLNKKRIIIS